MSSWRSDHTSSVVFCEPKLRLRDFNDPSLRDILRMARPTPKDNARRAMFGWLTDKTIDKWAPATEADLPVEVQSLIAYRLSQLGKRRSTSVDRWWT